VLIGTVEYTTGFVNNAASTSDKKVGVVALVKFDLRRRDKVSQLSMAGVSGRKLPAIRQHLEQKISRAYNNVDVSFTSSPSDTTSDAEVYKSAIDTLPKDSAVTIFTPDPTHFPIATYAIERGNHVLTSTPFPSEDASVLVRLLIQHWAAFCFSSENYRQAVSISPRVYVFFAIYRCFGYLDPHSDVSADHKARDQAPLRARATDRSKSPT
jgi:hypothetical protein